MNCEFENLVKGQYAGATITDDGINKYVQFTSGGNKVATLPNTFDDEEVWQGAWNKHLADGGSDTITRDFDPGKRPGENYKLPVTFTHDTVPVLYNIASRPSAASQGSIGSAPGIASVAAGATKPSTGSIGAIASAASIVAAASAASFGSMGNHASTGSVGSVASTVSVATSASVGSVGSSGTVGSIASKASVASSASYAGQCHAPERQGVHEVPTSDLAPPISPLTADLDADIYKVKSSSGDLNLEATDTAGSDVVVKASSTGRAVIRREGGSAGQDEFYFDFPGNIPRFGEDLYDNSFQFTTNGVVGYIRGASPKFDFNQTAFRAQSSAYDVGATAGYEFRDLFLHRHINLKVTSDPSTVTDNAHVYAKDVSSSAEIFVRDEGGTVTQISAHSRLAPSSLYDEDDGDIDMIVQEIQYFQGFVRFTNKTRLAKLMSMTEEEKSALTAEQRQCVTKESFEDYNERTGQNLAVLDWDIEQNRLQAEYDAKRAEIFAASQILKDQKIGELDVSVLNDLDIQIALIESDLPPEKNIKKPKPAWL